MFVDSFVSCFVDVGILCCLLQVNYLRSFAMCACFAKFQKGREIRFYFTFFILFGIGRGVGGRTWWGSGGRNHFRRKILWKLSAFFLFFDLVFLVFYQVRPQRSIVLKLLLSQQLMGRMPSTIQLQQILTPIILLLHI